MVYKQKHLFCTKVLIRRGMQQDIFICKFFIFIIHISMRTILGLQVLSKARGNSIRFQVICFKISKVVNNLFNVVHIKQFCSNVVHIKQFCCVLCVMWSIVGCEERVIRVVRIIWGFFGLVGGGGGSLFWFGFWGFFLGWLFIKKIMFGNT